MIGICRPVSGSATFTVTATASGSGTISNTATIAAPSGFNDPAGNNTATDANTVITPTADLSITKTDGVTGVGRIAEDEAVLRGGRVIEIVADSLSARSQEPDMQRLIGQRSGACVSITHPDAPYTVPHALARNKCVYALANAAFVIAADQRRGATFAGAAEALRNRYCDFVYVWDTKLYPGNGELAARGATPFAGIAKTAFEQMAKGWRGAKAEQLSMFDRGGVWP